MEFTAFRPISVSNWKLRKKSWKLTQSLKNVYKGASMTINSWQITPVIHFCTITVLYTQHACSNMGEEKESNNLFEFLLPSRKRENQTPELSGCFS